MSVVCKNPVWNHVLMIFKVRIQSNVTSIFLRRRFLWCSINKKSWSWSESLLYLWKLWQLCLMCHRFPACLREKLHSRHRASDAVWVEAVQSGSSSPRQSPAEILQTPQTPPGSETLLQQVYIHVGSHTMLKPQVYGFTFVSVCIVWFLNVM